MREPPPAAYVVAALVALCLSVREARRVRTGDRRARAWFVIFLASAAVFTAFAVDLSLGPHRP